MKLNTRTCDTYTRKTSPIFNIQRPVLFTSHSVIDDQPQTGVYRNSQASLLHIWGVSELVRANFRRRSCLETLQNIMLHFCFRLYINVTLPWLLHFCNITPKWCQMAVIKYGWRFGTFSYRERKTETGRGRDREEERVYEKKKTHTQTFFFFFF